MKIYTSQITCSLVTFNQLLDSILNFNFLIKQFMYSKSKYAGLPEFVDYLHKNGLHYIPIIDPAISSSEKLGTYKPYEIGLEMNVFIQNISGDPFEGRVWTNGKCVWPDFTNPKVLILSYSVLYIMLTGSNNQFRNYESTIAVSELFA